MNKGTLTILSDTNAILGLPIEPPYPESVIMRCRDAVTAWLKDGGVLTLPFPIEVIDMRNYGNKTVTVDNVVGDVNTAIALNNDKIFKALIGAVLGSQTFSDKEDEAHD